MGWNRVPGGGCFLGRPCRGLTRRHEVSFLLDLFIYEWEMVCGFSSAFVSVMKYIRNKAYNGNFNSGYRLGWVIVRGL